MEVLSTLSADRYGKACTIITSNFTFSEWEKIFKDPMTTAAAIDRLVRHRMIKELNLDSYLIQEAKYSMSIMSFPLVRECAVKNAHMIKSFSNPAWAAAFQ